MTEQLFSNTLDKQEVSSILSIHELKEDKLITLPSGKSFYDNISVESRFLKKVLKDTESDCWIWNGATTRGGYGHFRIKTPEGWSMLRAHIYAHWKYNGGVGIGKEVMHSCDNPFCCNPQHLSLGTTKENQKDSKDKGRNAKGLNSVTNKHKLEGRPLDEDKVKEIWKLYNEGYNQRRIAEMIDIHFANVNRVLRKKTWAWVEV
jgi:hypothetical protein